MEDKVRMSMLGDLIHHMQSKLRPTNNLNDLRARFTDESGELVAEMQLDEALSNLFNNIYWFTEFDLRNATQAVVSDI